jgi:hypothetical protein
MRRERNFNLGPGFVDRPEDEKRLPLTRRQFWEVQRDALRRHAHKNGLPFR